MTTTLVTLPLRWVPSPQDAAVARVLDSWAGTPYMLSQAVKGQGVDCVRFVCAVYDELHGVKPQRLDRLPPDTALHDHAGAIAAMRKILRRYEPNAEIPLYECMAGDALIVGAAHGGPGHALIVGARPATLYHATASGVVRAGLTVPVGTHARLFRVLTREYWR